MVCCDLDADGDEDLVVALVGNLIAVLPNVGAGSFGAPSFHDAGPSSVGVACGDVDCDGAPDVVALNDTSPVGGGSVTVLVNDGAGGLPTSFTFTVGPDPRAVLVADFDDCRPALDVVTANTNASTLSLLTNASCDPLVEALCAGDGSSGPCPCGNAGGAGEGCANSTAKGALLTAGGDACVSSGTLVLTTTQMPGSSIGILFMGDALLPPSPLGDGLRCAGGSTWRWLPALGTGPLGTFNHGPGLSTYSVANFPAAFHLLPGTTWSFQSWYRDVASPCGGGHNLSNALRVSFLP